MYEDLVEAQAQRAAARRLQNIQMPEHLPGYVIHEKFLEKYHEIHTLIMMFKRFYVLEHHTQSHILDHLRLGADFFHKSVLLTGKLLSI